MTLAQKAGDVLARVRAQCPLIHNITNYVTVNDVANAVLALGASPIMADDIAEAADITAISAALVMNMGTLHERTVASMLDAGKRANAMGLPVVLDPVGAGVSKLRNGALERLLREVRLTVLRGNLSEISFAAGLQAAAKGVDVSEADASKDPEAVAVAAAQRIHCVVAITGAVDVVTDGERVARIHNGHRMLSRVTGTGCMTSALVGACVGAVKDPFLAAVAGVASMGIAGELAFERAGAQGTGSFHMAILDALSHMDGPLMAQRGKIDEA